MIERREFMDYAVSPFGDVWQNGIFNISVDLVDKYFNFATEKQIKALLFILRHGGKADTKAVSSVLGVDEKQADEILEFWVLEGVIACNNQLPAQPEKAEKVKVVKINTDENLKTVTVLKDNVEVEYKAGMSFTEDGEYKITAVDKVENQTSIAFVIDKTAPTIEVKLTSNNKYWESYEVSFNDAGSGIAEVKWDIDEKRNPIPRFPPLRRPGHHCGGWGED